MELPITTSGWLVDKTGITPATVNKSLGLLQQLDPYLQMKRMQINLKYLPDSII